MSKAKWFKGEKCDMFVGKKNLYAFGTNEKKSFLIISSRSKWDYGWFHKVKDFAAAKQIVISLEK